MYSNKIIFFFYTSYARYFMLKKIYIKIYKRFIYNITGIVYYSNKEVSFRDGSDLVQEVSQKIANLENSSVTLVQIFLILFDVLQECLSSYQDPVKTPVTDVNNNIISSINTSDIKQDNLSANTTETLGNDKSILTIDEKYKIYKYICKIVFCTSR